MNAFCGHATGIVDMLVEFVPSPKVGAQLKVETAYTGPLDSDLAISMKSCNPDGPLMLHIVKLYHKPDCTTFDAFGLVVSGSIKIGDTVNVLGENYSLEDDEDMSVQVVTDLWVYEGRYRIPIPKADAGNWVLVGGIDNSIMKTATITHHRGNEDACIFAPITHQTQSVVKLALEPLNP